MRLQTQANAPVAKMAKTPHFLCLLIWSRHTTAIGSTKIKRSVAALMALVAMSTAMGSTHFPSIKGSQIFSRGQQAKTATKSTAV